jgi:hypothetical protein
MLLDITHRPVFFQKHRSVYFSKHNVSDIAKEEEEKKLQLRQV